MLTSSQILRLSRLSIIHNATTSASCHVFCIPGRRTSIMILTAIIKGHILLGAKGGWKSQWQYAGRYNDSSYGTFSTTLWQTFITSSRRQKASRHFLTLTFEECGTKRRTWWSSCTNIWTFIIFFLCLGHDHERSTFTEMFTDLFSSWKTSVTHCLLCVCRI